MVAITQNSELYDKVFKGISLPDTFISRYPTYEEIANGFLDPSNEAQRLQEDRLNGDQTGDIRNSSRLIVKDLSMAFGSSAPINFPSNLIDGLFNIMHSADVEGKLSKNDVLNKVMTNKADSSSNAIGGVPGLVVGTALLTLSATVPLVGMIASAIVGIAAGIAKLIKNRDEKLEAAKEENKALLYKTFAPLQVAGSGTDSALVNEMRNIFRTNDWTNIFAPRFKGKEWVGIERIGGFAFAPGSVEENSSNFAADVNEKFIPTLGFGIIPGTDIVTSVIQVSLPHDKSEPGSDLFLKYVKGFSSNAQDPRTMKNAWSRVTDVGTYYPSTGKLGAAWWTIALKEGNWYKFRIDTNRLHDEWKEYCESGLRFIRNKCYLWNANIENLEGYFGTSIYYAIGAWSGRMNGGTTNIPKYEVSAKPFGYCRDEIIKYKLFPNSKNSGAFLPVDSRNSTKSWCDSCMGTMYDRGYDIQSKLNDLKNRQEWDLYKTLTSAYCSQFDAAFEGDPYLKQILFKQRAKLLKSQDRKRININDVFSDEPGLPGIKNSESWKQQLLNSGVPLILPKMSGINNFDLKVQFGDDAPPNLNPPSKEIEVDAGPINPYDPNYKITRVGRPSPNKSGSNNSMIALAGIGTVAYFIFGK